MILLNLFSSWGLDQADFSVKGSLREPLVVLCFDIAACYRG